MTSRPALLLILLLTGCSVGLRVNRFAPAQRPAGVIGRLEVAHVGSFDAELLAVDDTSLRMLEGTELIRVPLRLIRRARFAQFGNLCDWKGARLDRLRLLSRFPGGVTPAMMPQLLAASGQPAAHVLEGREP